METTLHDLSPKNVTWEDNPSREPLDLVALFGDARPVWLEIGFGGGEHLLHMVQPLFYWDAPHKNLNRFMMRFLLQVQLKPLFIQ